MAKTKNLFSVYAAENYQSSTISEKIMRDRLQNDNPNSPSNPFKLKKEFLKRVDRKMPIDSSYYLG